MVVVSTTINDCDEKARVSPSTRVVNIDNPLQALSDNALDSTDEVASFLHTFHTFLSLQSIATPTCTTPKDTNTLRDRNKETTARASICERCYQSVVEYGGSDIGAKEIQHYLHLHAKKVRLY